MAGGRRTPTQERCCRSRWPRVLVRDRRRRCEHPAAGADMLPGVDEICDGRNSIARGGDANCGRCELVVEHLRAQRSRLAADAANVAARPLVQPACGRVLVLLTRGLVLAKSGRVLVPARVRAREGWRSCEASGHTNGERWRGNGRVGMDDGDSAIVMPTRPAATFAKEHNKACEEAGETVKRRARTPVADADICTRVSGVGAKLLTVLVLVLLRCCKAAVCWRRQDAIAGSGGDSILLLGQLLC